ncbi:hypothetical protein R3P38DRAFT_3090861 [Favolaschia claudopus]|uniref:Uncharacterized protein n=1 Tax=Favolaschia claudopus TaxID=2862362 RepID=A0AAV9ZS25_9AGAR
MMISGDRCGCMRCAVAAVVGGGCSEVRRVRVCVRSRRGTIISSSSSSRIERRIPAAASGSIVCRLRLRICQIVMSCGGSSSGMRRAGAAVKGRRIVRRLRIHRMMIRCSSSMRRAVVPAAVGGGSAEVVVAVLVVIRVGVTRTWLVNRVRVGRGVCESSVRHMPIVLSASGGRSLSRLTAIRSSSRTSHRMFRYRIKHTTSWGRSRRALHEEFRLRLWSRARGLAFGAGERASNSRVAIRCGIGEVLVLKPRWENGIADAAGRAKLIARRIAIWQGRRRPCLRPAQSIARERRDSRFEDPSKHREIEQMTDKADVSGQGMKTERTSVCESRWNLAPGWMRVRAKEVVLLELRVVRVVSATRDRRVWDQESGSRQ